MQTATDNELIEAARMAVKDYYAALKAKDWKAAGLLVSERNIHTGPKKMRVGGNNGNMKTVIVDGAVVTLNLWKMSWGPLRSDDEAVPAWTLRKVTVSFREILGDKLIGFKVVAEAEGNGKIWRGKANPNAILEDLGWKVNVPSATICWR